MATHSITPAPAFNEGAAPRGEAVAHGGRSGRATVALVCGILMFPVGLYAGPVALPLAIAAVLVGRAAKKQIATDPGLQGGGAAQAGFVLGIIGIVLSVLFVVFVLLAFSAFDRYDV